MSRKWKKLNSEKKKSKYLNRRPIFEFFAGFRKWSVLFVSFKEILDKPRKDSGTYESRSNGKVLKVNGDPQERVFKLVRPYIT